MQTSANRIIVRRLTAKTAAKSQDSPKFRNRLGQAALRMTTPVIPWGAVRAVATPLNAAASPGMDLEDRSGYRYCVAARFTTVPKQVPDFRDSKDELELGLKLGLKLVPASWGEFVIHGGDRRATMHNA